MSESRSLKGHEGRRFGYPKDVAFPTPMAPYPMTGTWDERYVYLQEWLDFYGKNDVYLIIRNSPMDPVGFMGNFYVFFCAENFWLLCSNVG